MNRDTWAMGQTLRWHSSPWPALRNSGDTVDAHQNRMIRDARLYFPRAGMELVDAIIGHDLPECLSGDYSTPDKDSIPGLRASLDAVDWQAWALGIQGIGPILATLEAA